MQRRDGYLVAIVTLVRLLSAVCPLVSLHVILLDELHTTLITAKRLLPYHRNKEKYKVTHLRLESWTKSSGIRDYIHPTLTSMDLLMSLEKIFLDEAHVTLAALERLLT